MTNEMELEAEIRRLNKEIVIRDCDLANLRRFLGKVQGVCMGVAMSDCHPDPDGALMDLFHEAQDILFPEQAKAQ